LNEGAIQMGLKAPDNWQPEPFDADAFEQGLKAYAEKLINQNRERAEAIVYAVQLEELLEDVLIDFFVEGKSSTQVLDDIIDTLGTKINLGYCLGLISSDEANDLNIIRKIRNHFAHSKDCSFGDQKIIDLCKNFRIPKQSPDFFANYTTLEIFQAVAFVLTENLVTRSWNAKKRKCVVPDEIDPKSWEDF
jgi:hypothetical protein